MISCTDGSDQKTLSFLNPASAKVDSYWVSCCDINYPLTLVLELECLSNLNRIQILSHEYFISSRIVISTSKSSAFESSTNLDDTTFQELGQVLLDPNTKSGYQSRELKTIHVDRVCYQIKFSLYAPHPNKLNPKHQVSLVSISCYGQPVDPIISKFPNSAVQNQNNTETTFSSRLKALESQLTRAHKAGDTTNAAHLQKQLSEMRSISAQIEALESEKQEAVRLEDYDLAKSIKLRIDKLRSLNENEETLVDRGKSMIGEFASFLGNEAVSAGITLPSFGTTADEALPDADPLPSYFARDYPHLIDSLGERTVALLVSRDWRLREKGVGHVISLLQDKKDIDISAISWVARKLTSEKIVNLIIKLCDLVQALVAAVPRPETSVDETLEFVIIYIIENKLIDGNKRLVDSVVMTIVKVCESSSQRANMVNHYLLKGHPIAKSVSGRCLCLMSLIQSFGFRSKRSLNPEALIHAIAEWYPRSTPADTRFALMQVLAETVKQLGQDKVEQLIMTGTSGAIKDSLLFELTRLPIRTVLSNAGEPELALACEFCGKKDPSYSLEENMDIHFWDECPALVECAYCEQVVEITGLTEHRLKECENIDALIQ